MIITLLMRRGGLLQLVSFTALSFTPDAHQTAADFAPCDGGSVACGTPGWVLGRSSIRGLPTADQAPRIPLLTPEIHVSPRSGMRRTGKKPQSACSGFIRIQVGISRLSLARDSLYDILHGENEMLS